MRDRLPEALKDARRALEDTPTGSNVFGWRVATSEDYDRVADALQVLIVYIGELVEVEWCIEHNSQRVDDESYKCWKRLAAWEKTGCYFACTYITVGVTV